MALKYLKKEEKLNLVVSFVALESNLPMMKGKDIYLSMVFKRGSSDRIESSRILYESLEHQISRQKDQDKKDALYEINRKNYDKIMVEAGHTDDEDFSLNSPGDNKND